ncbi:hypothetical protein N9L26_02110 [Candidatus Pacebacteria bacterium]|nr:hypothetical protein [Candidatus Paceibacterota bacterium]
MSPEAKQIITDGLKAGAYEPVIRSQLISEGHSTDGFHEAYLELAGELGITPAAPPVPEAVNTDQYATAMHTETGVAPNIPTRESHLAANVTKIGAGLLVLLVAVIVLSGYGTNLRTVLFGSDAGADLSPTDLTRQTQMRTLQSSAETFKARLLDYRGVCSDIGIDDTIFSCTDTADAYAITTPLTNGLLYCVDSTGYTGEVAVITDDELACGR